MPSFAIAHYRENWGRRKATYSCTLLVQSAPLGRLGLACGVAPLLSLLELEFDEEDYRESARWSVPNPHFDVQIIARRKGNTATASAAYRSGTKIASRQGGKSALAAAAYRSGERLYDESEQQYYDYTRKEDVIHAEIMLPEHAPDWARLLSREQLWNLVEATEIRKDAQLARDIIASLPRELTYEQQSSLVKDYVQAEFTSKGMIADVAIHDTRASDGQAQPHVHIMLTMRELGKSGFGKKNRDWNHRSMVRHWRSSWEECTNHHLEQAGRRERVSLKSYRERGIDRIPQEYLGPKLWQLEQRGIRTERGNRNRWIRAHNRAQEAIESLLRRNAIHQADQAEHDRSLARGIGINAPEGDRIVLHGWQRIQQRARQILQATGNILDLPAQKAMRHSREDHHRLQGSPGVSSYKLMRTSQKLVDEREEERDMER